MLFLLSFLLNWTCCILTSRIGTSLQKCHHHHHLHYYFVLQQLPRTPHFYFFYYYFFSKSSEVTFPKSIILLFCSFSLVSEKFWSLLPPGHPYPSYLLYLLFSIIKDPFMLDEKHSHFSFSTSPRTKQEFTRHLVHFRDEVLRYLYEVGDMTWDQWTVVIFCRVSKRSFCTAPKMLNSIMIRHWIPPWVLQHVPPNTCFDSPLQWIQHYECLCISAWKAPSDT